MATPSLTIDLSAPERDALLKHVPLPTNIVARLRFAVHTTKGLEFVLAGDDVIDFGEAVEEYLPRIKKRADARLVEEVFRRFVMKIDALVGDDLADLELPPNMPEAMREAVQQVFDSGEYATHGELMRSLQEAVVRADDSRHEQLFGHTTGEVLRLIGDNWTERGGAFWVDGALPTGLLASSSYCMNALRFLALAEKTGGFKLTPKKCLNRASVKLLLDADCFPEIDTERILSVSKIINEMDIWPLHMVHILLLEIGLVRHDKGKMVITKTGRRALEPDWAGNLQCVMFRTLFKDFDLAYLDRLPDYPGVQATIPFILYAIQKLAREPIAVGELMAKAYMPAVAAEFASGPYPKHAVFAFHSRVLNPLEGFGLLTTLSPEDEFGRDLSDDQVQITPLFDAMLHFDVMVR